MQNAVTPVGDHVCRRNPKLRVSNILNIFAITVFVFGVKPEVNSFLATTHSIFQFDEVNSKDDIPSPQILYDSESLLPELIQETWQVGINLFQLDASVGVYLIDLYAKVSRETSGSLRGEGEVRRSEEKIRSFGRRCRWNR